MIIDCTDCDYPFSYTLILYQPDVKIKRITYERWFFCGYTFFLNNSLISALAQHSTAMSPFWEKIKQISIVRKIIYMIVGMINLSRSPSMNQDPHQRNGTFFKTAPKECIVRKQSPDLLCRRDHLPAYILCREMEKEEQARWFPIISSILFQMFIM